MEKKKRIVIIGATSLIAEHCARLWVKGSAVDLTLVGRNLPRIEKVAADLRARSPHSEIRTLQTEFLEPSGIKKVVDTIVSHGEVNTVLIAHGVFPDQRVCQQDLSTCRDALNINGISSVLFAEAFAASMDKASTGTLALISSLAGERGRKTNYVYGAAKSLINCYVQGLQHRFAGTDINVVLIKPGVTDTPMTAQRKKDGTKLASAEDVAKKIVVGIEKRQAVIYVPRKWQLIMWIVRSLPNFIFNKLNV